MQGFTIDYFIFALIFVVPAVVSLPLLLFTLVVVLCGRLRVFGLA